MYAMDPISCSIHVRNHYLDLEFNEKKEGWKERKRDKVEKGLVRLIFSPQPIY